MRLYGGPVTDLIDDSVHNRIAEKVKSVFFANFGYEASPGEINFWRSSLRAASQAFEAAKLNDHGVMLEYQLRLSSRRLHCMVTGRDEMRLFPAAIVELKQWDRCEESDGDRIVTSVGGSHNSPQLLVYRVLRGSLGWLPSCLAPALARSTVRLASQEGAVSCA